MLHSLAQKLIGKLAFVSLLGVTGCSVPIASGLDEPAANEALVALEKNGISASKGRDLEAEGRYQLEVSRDDASAAVSVLSQEGLPAHKSPGVLDALGQSSVIPSRLSEHAKLTAGIAGELERSLRELDGVVSARVHLAVPAKDALIPDETELAASASVLIRHRGPNPPLTSADIQRLVSGAVPGLSPENVSVVASSVPTVSRARDRDLSRLGPIAVTRSSALPLRLLFGAAALLNVLLVAGMGLLWQRLRRSEQALAERPARTAESTP
jgi:type III secretion protein J